MALYSHFYRKIIAYYTQTVAIKAEVTLKE